MTLARTHAQELFDGIMTYIHDAREMTERGEFIALETLDARVKTLCDAVAQLSVEDSMALRDDLEQMMAELNALQELFVEKRDGLAKDITGAGKHKQAAKAYMQQEATAARSASQQVPEPEEQ